MKNIPLQFDFSSCVHVYYRDSSCSLCKDVCPVEDAITQEDYKIILNSEKCVSCGACIGVCPSEAFSFKNLDISHLYEKIISENKTTLSCKRDIPCLTALNVEYLISVVINLEEDFILDIGHCKNCSIGNLLEEIEKKTEEANYFLQKLGIDKRVLLQELNIQTENKEEKDRRKFLRNFGKAAAGLTFWALMPKIPVSEEKEEEQPKNIVEEKVSINKRKVLIKSLQKLNIDYSNIEFEVDKLSFTSDKWIDNQKCTNCSVCYNICPTGALKAGEERLKILFEPKLCIKCRVCHEVCPEDCLHLKDTLNLKTFMEETEILAQHIMIPCEECLIPFSYKGDTTLCPRCRQLDDEIRDLLKIEQ